jgi:hypothetical protein
MPCLPCSVETATQTLHRLTSYQPGREWDEAIEDPRIVKDLEANDMSRLPWFIKQYAERAVVTPLPRELPVTTEPALAVLAGTADVKPAPLDLPNLSRLLYLSAGVVRIMERDYGIHPFRAAGSQHHPALHVHAAVCIYLQPCPRCSAPCPSANASASPSPAVSTPR